MAIFSEELSTHRLELRAIPITHVDAAFDAVTESLGEVRHWLWWAQGPLDEDSYRNLVRSQAENFANDVEWRYFIFDRSTTNLVGGCSVDLVSHDRVSANLGYWIRTSLTGQGLATHIAQLMTGAAFEYLPQISSVEISMDVNNVASARIPEKLGFTRLGEFDKAVRAPGHSGRGFIWSMERTDWPRSEAAH
ncbi:MAG: GNAT family N-acetyltransferase [Acidobacteria bacterium]|nr:GNAT family N-acetyltransferase [Acidobacteriota bacterium]